MSKLQPQSVILIVDDNPDTIQLLSALLKDKGELLFATNGQDAISLAEQELPHLILLDMEMPDMNGDETCRALKRNYLTRECTIIFITAHSSMEMELNAFDAGAVDFISKPFNPVLVNARVDTHLTLKHHADALQRLANRDGLTGVYNRRFFDEQLESEFRRHIRHDHSLTVVLLDLDYFKVFNDGYGHLEGDECLKQVAQAVESGFRRPGEAFCRYGGEEFAVILPQTPTEATAAVGERICTLIRELQIPHAYSKVASVVTTSVGLATLTPGSGLSLRELMRKADEALYRAKANGRNGWDH